MKRIVVVLIGLILILPFLSLATDQKRNSNVELNTFSDKISYVLGQEIGESFKESPTEIKLELFRVSFGLEMLAVSTGLIKGQRPLPTIEQKTDCRMK